MRSVPGWCHPVRWHGPLACGCSPRLAGLDGVAAEFCCAHQAMVPSAAELGPFGDRSGLGPEWLGDLQLLLGPVGRQGGQEAGAVTVNAKHGGRGNARLHADLACSSPSEGWHRWG